MTTMGQIVRKWREDAGLSVPAFAKLVGTKRQNIENFENDRVSQPRYLSKLAKVMGYASSDDLVALREPPASVVAAERPASYRTSTPSQVVRLGSGSADAQAMFKKIGSLLQAVRSEDRAEVAGALNSWALSGGKESHIPLLLDLLVSDTASKQQQG